jgi:hypothetical protein
MPESRSVAIIRAMLLRSGGLTSAAVLVLPILAHAQDGQRGMAEMRMAEKCAALAADAQRLEDIRANLQQALNCLEGRQGPDYRRSAGDPCSGTGAVRELPAGSVNKIRVEKAIRLAVVGVTFHDF